MSLRFIPLLFLLPVLGLAAPVVRAADATTLFSQGFELLQAGDLPGAQKKFEAGLKLEPKNAQAQFFLAEALRGQGANDKAQTAYKKALALKLPVNLEALAKAHVSKSAFQAGAKKKDCDACPTLVAIPGGQFVMGSPPAESGRNKDEGPARLVVVKPFYMTEAEVTRQQFAAFVQATGYETDAERNLEGNAGCLTLNADVQWVWTGHANWRTPGFEQSDAHPVVCISHNDARAYARWLTARTGKAYRLPSEAEWEYAARAGSQAAYAFGDNAAQLCVHGNGGDLTYAKQFSKDSAINHDCADGHVYTAPARSFKANAFGLFDLHGNAWEWVLDCYQDSYAGAPPDASAWEAGECKNRVLRGGGWRNLPAGLRSANRDGGSASDRFAGLGFRLVQDLPAR